MGGPPNHTFLHTSARMHSCRVSMLPRSKPSKGGISTRLALEYTTVMDSIFCQLESLCTSWSLEVRSSEFHHVAKVVVRLISVAPRNMKHSSQLC